MNPLDHEREVYTLEVRVRNNCGNNFCILFGNVLVDFLHHIGELEI
jgi:hypothetical protein